MLSIAEIRELIESDASDISDVALQVFIDEAIADLTREIGDEGDDERTEILDGCSLFSIYASRRIASIDSIQERDYGEGYETVDPIDYDFRGRRIRRISGRWEALVSVTYTPVAEIPQRNALVSRLVAVAAQFSPHSSSNTGGITKSTREHTEQKELILADARGIRGAILGV